MEKMNIKYFNLLHIFLIISVLAQDSAEVDFGLTVENVNRTVHGWQVPLCPLTAFCSDGGNSISCDQRYDDTNLACRCDPQCVFYNDCCLDYALSCADDSIFDEPFAESVNGINPEDVICAMTPGSPSFGYYQLVSRCPDYWTQDDVRMECERDPDLRSPRQFIPVDFMDDITFKNVYCAICNGKDIRDVTPWAFGTMCDVESFSVIQNSPFEEQVVFLIEQCMPNDWTLEPSSSGARSCTPSPKSNTCQSPMMTLATGSLYDACLFYQAEIEIESVKYRNPHCFQCINGGSYSEVDSILRGIPCSRIVIVIPRPGPTPPPNPERKPVVSISLLLDFSSPVPPTLCRADQLFDAQNLLCVNLTCAESFFLDKDQSCIREDLLDRSCLNDTTLPTIINIECADRLSRTTEQCLPSVLLTHELQFALGDVINVTKMLTVNRIQAMTPNVDVNETKCTRTVDVSGYLEGDFSKQLDLFSYTTEPGNITLPSFDCEVSRYQVTYGCLSEIIDCPNLNIVSNPQPQFDEITGGLYFRNYNTTFLNSRYYLTYSLNISTNSYKKQEYISVCNFTNTMSCPLLTLNASLFEENLDGSLLYVMENITFLSGEFKRIGNHSVQVCNFIETIPPRFLNFSQTQVVLSTVGSCLSILALLLTIATYGRFKSLRKITFNVLILSLCVSLVLAHTLLLLSGLSVQIPGACIAVAILGHYMWLVVFSHTSALAVDLHRRFGLTVNLGQANEGAAVRSYFLVFAWTFPLLIMIPCICIFFIGFDVPNFNLSYGQGVCWIGDGFANLYVFGIPIAVFILSNLIMFVSIVVGIRNKMAPTGEAKSYSQKISDQWIHVKMSTLLGFTWIFGFIAAFADVTALWYIFILLTSLQGVYIFIAFVCNKRVFKLWCESCSCLTSSKSSSKSRSTSSDAVKVTRSKEKSTNSESML